MTLIVGVERVDDAARMLAALPWRFTVVRPDELRAAVAALADDLQAAAGGAPVRFTTSRTR